MDEENEYRFPRSGGDSGWPAVLEFDQKTFVRIRDGQRDNPDNPVAPSVLYALVASSFDGPTVDQTRMWTPQTSINENHQGGKLIGMVQGPWASNEELLAAGQPQYEIPEINPENL